MTDNKAGMPYSGSRMATYLTKQIEAIASEKNQRKIAYEIGYEKPNMISMFKRGETKVPLDKIPALAKALKVDPTHLFRLGLEQYWPELAKTIQDMLDRQSLVTRNEVEIILFIRQLTHDRDLSMSADLKARIEEAFKASVPKDKR